MRIVTNTGVAAALVVMAALALPGCSRGTEHVAPAAQKPAAASNAAASNVPRDTGQPARQRDAEASLPSYEVALASAQADRVHALNACDDKRGASRAACVREADRTYDEAREVAEKIHGSGR